MRRWQGSGSSIHNNITSRQQQQHQRNHHDTRITLTRLLLSPVVAVVSMHSTSHILISLLLVTCSSHFALAATSTTSSTLRNAPRIDYEALGGSLGVVGAFSGIEVYDSSGTGGFISSTSASSSSNQTSVSHLISLNNQASHPSNIASVQGDILAIEQCGTEGGIYFGGTFTTIKIPSSSSSSSSTSISTTNIAVYFPSNSSITPLQSGLDGTVSALTCDGDTLYVGGSFKQPINAKIPTGEGGNSQYEGAVALWNTASQTWSPIGFGGFKGNDVEVLSIAISNDGGESTTTDKSILFGGSFQTYWLNDTSSSSSGSSPHTVTVTTVANGTITISASNSSATDNQNGIVNVYPSLGSSLVPISLASAEISASSSSFDSRYSDPSNIFCPAGDDGMEHSTWLGRSGDQSSRITARLFAPLDVGGIRIGNTNVNGDGTQTFRYVQSLSVFPSEGSQ